MFKQFKPLPVRSIPIGCGINEGYILAHIVFISVHGIKNKVSSLCSVSLWPVLVQKAYHNVYRLGIKLSFCIRFHLILLLISNWCFVWLFVISGGKIRKKVIKLWGNSKKKFLDTKMLEKNSLITLKIYPDPPFTSIPNFLFKGENEREGLIFVHINIFYFK